MCLQPRASLARAGTCEAPWQLGYEGQGTDAAPTMRADEHDEDWQAGDYDRPDDTPRVCLENVGTYRQGDEPHEGDPSKGGDPPFRVGGWGVP